MSETKSCQRYPHLKFVSATSGECNDFQCNCYKCEQCGPRKIKRLYIAIRKWLEQFKYVRMWTFTMTTRYSETTEAHAIALQEVWRRFWKEIRRSKALSEAQRKVQYVRVVELHASHTPSGDAKKVVGCHYHVLTTEYLPWHVVSAIWERSCEEVLTSRKGGSEHLGSAYIKGSISAKNAARYVTKYVTKCIKDEVANRRKWSRSGKVALFSRRERTESDIRYTLINLNRTSLLSYFTCTTLEQLPEVEQVALFEMSHSPPESHTSAEILEVFAE